MSERDEHYDPPFVVEPFVTHHKGEHCIGLWHGKPWLFWRHPDGQWVTECAVQLSAEPRPDLAVEVRYTDAGTVDEILGTGWLHMEQMDADLWWFGFHPEGRAGARMAWTICGRVCTITEPLAPCGPAETVE